MPLNIPNTLTWARIALIPIFVGVFYLPDSLLSVPHKNLIATSLFAAAAVTDWFDGFLARALGQTPAKPAATKGLSAASDQDQAGAAFTGVLDQGFRHFAGPQGDHLTAKAFGQLLSHLQVSSALFVTRATGVHMHHRPR